MYGDVKYLKDRMAAIEQYLAYPKLSPKLRTLIEGHKVQVQGQLKKLEQCK